MSVARKCDICGTLYKEYNMADNHKRPNSIQLLNTDSENKYYAHGRIDCCPDCMGKIVAIISD